MKEYILHLIGEMARFILDANPSRMVISLHWEKDGLHLAILDNNPRSEKELESIRSALNPERRPELSEYYGIMAGHDLLGSSRLNLVGWQVKHADVSRTQEGTKIDLWLGGEGFDSASFSIPKEGKG
ncbi:MAG: hypothetical protein N2442_06015 [Spirochaetes bacterium]|nr:hypothetical protein [Spirochaetota bacterium]